MSDSKIQEGVSVKSYEHLLQPVRETFSTGNFATTLLHPDIDPTVLHLYLLNFATVGFTVTKPVVGWLQRTADRCINLGLREVGHALHEHLQEEEGHDLMHFRDLTTHVDNWNSKHERKFTVEQLVNLPLTSGAAQFHELHERIINSDRPYCQFAIELEIGWISCRFGEEFLRHCVRRIGPDILKGLSFVKAHATLDPQHINFNRAQIENVLRRYPDSLPHLVQTGKESLLAYEAYASDCLTRAQETHV